MLAFQMYYASCNVPNEINFSLLLLLRLLLQRENFFLKHLLDLLYFVICVITMLLSYVSIPLYQGLYIFHNHHRLLFRR